MTRPLSVAVEAPPRLPAAAEARLLEAALHKRPQAAATRNRLALLWNQLDRFDRTVELLAPDCAALDFDAALLLAAAAFAGSGTAAEAPLAEAAADRAVAAAASDRQRARAMAEQAKARLRRGETAGATGLLRDALALDPRSVAAFKRLAIQLSREGAWPALLELTDRLMAQGIVHARVLAARCQALAGLGRIEEARWLQGLPQLLRCELPDAPEAMPGDGFRAALAAELEQDPARRHDRFGTASQQTWRIDAPSATGSPLWCALLETLARRVEIWAATLDPSTHPWAAARPSRARLRSWCVMTGAQGHERWHMHPEGWLSGGFYPQVPASTAQEAGALVFGLPEGFIGEAAARAVDGAIVRPEPGLLTLFPSHVQHRTVPHGAPGQRICIAFDVVPA